MAQTDKADHADKSRPNPDWVSGPRVEPYSHDVLITAAGETLARSSGGLLLRETYAPDIYMPAGDVNWALLSQSATETFCPHKNGVAKHYDAVVYGSRIEDAAWCYENPLKRPELQNQVAFYFDKVKTEVDGRLVRGHVRDPHKTITVTPLGSQLRLEMEGQTVVDTKDAMLLEETGLPGRYYVPHDDVEDKYLRSSDRRSVCTYKGEATYHHLQVGTRVFENAVWAYDQPWTDFSSDVGLIKGHRGFYTSTFDRVLVDDVVVDASTSDATSDRAMIANPTIDQVLRETD